MASEDQLKKLMDLLKIPAGKQNFEELQDQIQNLIEENISFKKYCQSKNDNTLEKILNNPGLQHLAENIFGNLDFEHLMVCRGINQSSKQILDYQMDKPMFLLRKFRGLSKENQKDWIKVIESTKNFEKEKAISSYLLWNLKKEVNLPCKCKFVDLPCYSSPAVQDVFRKKILESCEKDKSSDEDMEIVKILAPLTESPNAPDNAGVTPIYWAAYRGHTESVKILAPLTDDPNAPNNAGATPIFWAAIKGHTEIVKILAPLTEKPNAPAKDQTPISWAAYGGYTESVKILAPLTDDPNAPDNAGVTPISWAAERGHTEIVKILAPLTENPNAPDENGKTPIYWAAYNGHTEIVKILVPLTDNPNAPDNNRQTPIDVAKTDEICHIL